MFTRRRFLTGSSVAAAGALGWARASAQTEGEPHRVGDRPRRIIHMVADGMSMGTLTCADHFATRTLGRGLTWMQLFNRPDARWGWMNMRSLNSLVTDSSAASSSWGSGTRIINGMVNQLGDGTPLTTLYELFADKGWRRGLVTTTEITHATPAGFATSVSSRDNGDEIAAQYLERRIDVLLGGGQKFFQSDKREDKRDLQGAFAMAGYHVMRDRDQFLSAPSSGRWLGIFSESHLPFGVDRRESEKLQKTVPTLAEMTAAALDRLAREGRFILQVEGGRVDHACHNNDGVAALHEQVGFDAAIDVVLEFQKQEPDTLVVITTDHGNANLGLNGTGNGYGQSNRVFDRIDEVRASFAEIKKGLKRKIKLTDTEGEEKKTKEKDIAVTPEEIVQVIGEWTGYEVPMEKAEKLRLALSDRGSAMYDMMKSDNAQLGQLMANHIGIGFTGTAHTADYVPVTAVGPGSELFHGFYDNTEIFRHYTALAGIDFQNPTEPLITGLGPAAGDVERIGEYA